MEPFFGLGFVPIWTAVGAAAWMPQDGFLGNALYCDLDGSLSYSIERRWAAGPIERFRDGTIQCWDWARIEYEDGRVLLVPILDASELHVKESYLGVPFVVELPEHVWRGDGVIKVVVWRN